MSDSPLGTVRSVVLAADDVSEAARFFAEHLGLELQFQDGGRWAQLSAGGISVALAGEDERPDGGVAVNVKVDDVEYAVARAVEAGALLIRPATRGEHEISAALRSPGGPLFYLYSSL
jgi:predicted enzyme related to lactoylglutathione lyase